MTYTYAIAKARAFAVSGQSPMFVVFDDLADGYEAVDSLDLVNFDLGQPVAVIDPNGDCTEINHPASN